MMRSREIVSFLRLKRRIAAVCVVWWIFYVELAAGIRPIS